MTRLTVVCSLPLCVMTRVTLVPSPITLTPLWALPVLIQAEIDRPQLPLRILEHLVRREKRVLLVCRVKALITPPTPLGASPPPPAIPMYLEEVLTNSIPPLAPFPPSITT